MSAQDKTSVGPSGDRSPASDAGLPGPDVLRQAAPPNTWQAAERGNTSDPTGRRDPEPGPPSATDHVDVNVVRHTALKLSNLAYLCTHGRQVTPAMIGPIVSDLADDLKQALTP